MISGWVLTKSMGPRVFTAELAEDRVYAKGKTVAKLIRMMGIEGISPRSFVSVTTIQSNRESTLPDRGNVYLIKGGSTGCSCQIYPIYAPVKDGYTFA